MKGHTVYMDIQKMAAIFYKTNQKRSYQEIYPHRI